MHNLTHALTQRAPRTRRKTQRPDQHAERAVDREKFQLFTKRRRGWVNVLRAVKEQMEAQGMCWRAIVEDV
jgi:hypothetical protein